MPDRVEQSPHALTAHQFRFCSRGWIRQIGIRLCGRGLIAGEPVRGAIVGYAKKERPLRTFSAEAGQRLPQRDGDFLQKILTIALRVGKTSSQTGNGITIET